MIFGTKRGLFELIFGFLKMLKTESESGPRNIYVQFSNKNGVEDFFTFFGTKRDLF